jgi:hypothetical protein
MGLPQDGKRPAARSRNGSPPAFIYSNVGLRVCLNRIRAPGVWPKALDQHLESATRVKIPGKGLA